MKEEIVDLLSYLDSKDFNDKNGTISDIAMLLEMSTYILNGGQIASRMNEFQCLLPEDLLSIRLSMDDQKEIVGALKERILSGDPQSPSMLWAIGKAYPEIGLTVLARILKNDPEMPDNEMSYQFLIALDNFIIFFAGKASFRPEKEFVRFLENKSQSKDECLAESAGRVLRKLR